MKKRFVLALMALLIVSCEWGPDQVRVNDEVSFQSISIAVGDTVVITIEGYQFEQSAEADPDVVEIITEELTDVAQYSFVGQGAGQTQLTLEYVQFTEDHEELQSLKYIQIVVSEGIALAVTTMEAYRLPYTDYLSPGELALADSISLTTSGGVGDELIFPDGGHSLTHLDFTGNHPGDTELFIMFYDSQGSLINSLLFEFHVSISKMVLVEFFTNSGCVNCPEGNEYMDNIMELRGEEIALVRYHVSWTDPHDPMNLYNPTEVMDRVLYYSTFAAPAFVVEGVYITSLNQTDWLNRIDDARGAEPPVYISPIDLIESVDSLFLSYDLEGYGADLGEVDVWSMVLEDSIYYAGSNGEDIHRQVMRDMAQTEFPNGSDGINVTQSLKKPDAYGTGVPFSLIVFIQDRSTKAILQARKQILY